MRFISRPAVLTFLQTPPEGAKTQPTPSPTPDVFYAYINNTLVPFYNVPPLPTPPNDKVEYGLRGRAFRYQEKLDERRSRGVTPEETPPTADVHIRVVPGSEHTAAKMLVESGATLVRYSLAEDQPANSGFSLQWNGSGQSGTHEGFRRRYGRYPYLKSGMYPPRVSRNTPTITPRRQSVTPQFHSQTTLFSPSPRLRLVTPDAIAYILSTVESSMRTFVLILGTNQSGTGRMS